ncbi:transcriptional regulator, ArgR family [Oribacterium sp. KHPX15]|uniref:arginine repressor n=1 Tax=unclassified Oribacterium TaxID=2629782 RepID=UPI0004E25882|nr:MULTISPECIES: arginine repressor [unclassified Oribacterium]SEA31963.1 transcriptional regulator, ArgR family [Oribacterium sp. KHPX15]
MKKSRHQKIIELVGRMRIGTQEELADILIKEGYKVTQATVSRDIKELKLSKVAGNDGVQYYQIIEKEEQVYSEKYIRVLREALMSMDTAGNLLVIRTMSGMANAVAAALDQFRLEKIVGTLAGDDTIMCAMKNAQDAEDIKKRIQEIMG